MKKFLAVMAIMFLVASCTTKPETKINSESSTKVDIKTNSGAVKNTGKKALEVKQEKKIETKTGAVDTKKLEVKDDKTLEAKSNEQAKKISQAKTPKTVDGLEFTFITDKTEKVSNELKLKETISEQMKADPVLKTAKYKELDISDAEAKKIMSANSIVELPALLVNKNVWIEGQPALTYLQKTKGDLFLVQGGFYNPETKKYSQEIGSLCENKIDDNGNGKTDCQEVSCLQSNPKACEKEIEIAKKDFEKKQLEEQAKQKEEQAKKIETIKSDKPNVDLYVMSYCPYGTQAEKPFISIMKKFDKITNINIKFVQYVMHVKQGEGQENLLQYCVNTTQREKFIPYLECFLKNGKTEECIKSTGIDKTKLDACVKETDKKFEITKSLADTSKRFPDFNVNKEEALKAGVQGSPTLVINGLKIEGVARTEKGFATAICSTFKTQPEICKDMSKFSDATFKPGFGFDAPSVASNTKAAAGCAQ